MRVLSTPVPKVTWFVSLAMYFIALLGNFLGVIVVDKM